MSQRFAEIEHLESLSLPPAALATVSTDDKNGALQAASDEAAGYIRSLYTLPLISWGMDLRRHVSALAAFILMGHKGFKLSLDANEIIVKLHDDAIAWLTRVSMGRVNPGFEDSRPNPTGPRNIPIVVQGRVERGAFVVDKPKPRGW